MKTGLQSLTPLTSLPSPRRKGGRVVSDVSDDRDMGL